MIPAKIPAEMASLEPTRRSAVWKDWMVGVTGSEFGTLKRGTLCVQASQTIAGYTLPRHLVAFQRAYSRLWIQRPSSERRRDFNPPIHTLPAHTTNLSPPQGARPVPHGLPVGFAH